MKGLIVFLMVVASIVRADTLPPLELNDIVKEARLNNPELQAYRAEYEAAQARISGMRYLMDPKVDIEFADDMRMYSVTQEFPFPTKLGTLSALARAEARQYENMYRMKEQEVLGKVKKTYGDLYFAYKAIETTEKSVAYLNQLLRIASLSYALGLVPQTDVLQAQTELAKAENELLTLRGEKKIRESQINLLLNRILDREVGEPRALDSLTTNTEFDSLYSLARANHPELRAYQQILQQASMMVSVAQQMYLPDFMFRFSQQEMDFRFTDRKFMVGFTIPLWFWGKQRMMVKEARAMQRMSMAQYTALENKILVAVEEAKIRVDNGRRTQHLYRNSIIPQAEAALKSVLTSYEAHRIDFISVLESERTLIQAELEYHRALTDLIIARADLDEAVGFDGQENEEWR